MHLPTTSSSSYFKMMPGMELDTTMSMKPDDIVKDAFEEDNAPKMFMSENRMPVIAELSSVVIYVVFVALVLGVISIIPGVRKTKLASLLSLVTILLSGAIILLSIQDTYWCEASIEIKNSPFSVLISKRFNGTLSLQVGLSSANITLGGNIYEKAKLDYSMIEYVDFNERFYWLEAGQASTEHINALRRGLPNPILTVTEFLSQDSDGFNWSRRLRSSGYYTNQALYLAEVSWVLTLIFMCCIPNYMPTMVQVTGIMMMLAAFIYSTMITLSGKFEFYVSGQSMELVFGTTFYRLIIVGLLVLLSGKILQVLKSFNPNEELTIMDYEPYLKDQLACANFKANQLADFGTRKPPREVVLTIFEQNNNNINAA